MKRNIDTIRNIMIYLEENLKPGSGGIQSTQIPLYDEKDDASFQEFSEHIKLLIDQGFIEAASTHIKGFTIHNISRITSNGHDFLDAVRKDSTWEYTKSKALEIGGSTLSLMIEIAKDYLAEQLKQ